MSREVVVRGMLTAERVRENMIGFPGVTIYFPTAHVTAMSCFGNDNFSFTAGRRFSGNPTAQFYLACMPLFFE